MADNHWLTRAERALVVGSGVGAVASIAAQNIALASAPLTVLAAVGLFNRNRVEQQLEETQEKLIRQHRQNSHRLTNLSKQVTALPSPEALTNFQRAVMDRNNHSFIRFSKEMRDLRSQVNRQVQEVVTAQADLQTPDLSHINRQIAQLQDQAASTQANVDNISSYMQRLPTTARVETNETKLSHVKTDLMQAQVSLDNLRAETRTLITQLQDAVGQMERRWQDLPHGASADRFRAELGEVVKAIARLVPQAEFSQLVDHVKDITRQQSRLEQALTKIPVGTVSGMPATVPPPSTTELERLATEVQTLQQQVNRQATAGHTQEHVQQVVSQYLGQVRAQVSQLEGVTRSLSDRQQHLTEHLSTVPAATANRKALVQLAQRLKQTEASLQRLNQAPPAQSQSPAQNQAQNQAQSQPDWIIDLPVTATTEPQTLASRQALSQALQTAQRRVLLVWPWASYVTIDDGLLEQFSQLLERGGQLEIGWCHRGDQQDGRLAWRISQRWGTESSQLQLLKTALNQLLPLRESYPDRFKFRIMGTAESYLVCDSGSTAAADQTYAIVSLKALPTQSAAIPELEAKLRTAEPSVVQALIQRFHNPTIPPGDVTAFFNRGTTRHDLRDQPGAISDYSQVIALQPDHAIALNNRGVAQLELNQGDAAEADLSEAILQNPRLLAPHSNRGWLRLEQRRYAAAIADFTQAITLSPHLPMAYVYRGSALQKLGDLKGAVRDYSDAIACGDPIALPYCYRSAAYQSQGDQQRAIADLERASAYLEAQGDQQGLSSVQRTLSRLQGMATAV